MSESDTKYLPCPFCGCTVIREVDLLIAHDDCEEDALFAECMMCDAQARVEIWNNRTSGAEPGFSQPGGVNQHARTRLHSRTQSASMGERQKRQVGGGGAPADAPHITIHCHYCAVELNEKDHPEPVADKFGFHIFCSSRCFHEWQRSL